MGIVSISFSGIGLFLLLRPSYFFLPIFSYLFGAIIGAIGVLGIGFQLSKSSNIKGLDTLFMGLVLCAIWLTIYLFLKSLWANIISFILLILGCYGVSLGLIQGIYSIINNHKKLSTTNTKNSFGALLSQSILFLTQLCGLLIAILNISKAINSN